MEQQETIEKVKGDGGEATPAQEKTELQLLKEEVADIASDTQNNVYYRRHAAEDTRYCRWDAQSTDGRKHREDGDGAEPFPFEGASDARIRTADTVVNERVATLVTAAMRSIAKVKGMETTDEKFASRLQILLRWVIRNHLGSKYRVEITRLCQFQEGDSPGAAMLGVFWRQETALKMQDVSLAALIELAATAYQEQNQGDPEATQAFVEEFTAMLQDPEHEADAANWLMALFPTLKPRRARKVARELAETGAAEFPVPYLKEDGIELVALRLYEDVWIPRNTRDLQKSRVIFWREWLSRVDLEERRISRGYSEEFIKSVLEKGAGESGLPQYTDYWEEAVGGDYSNKHWVRSDIDKRKNEYEVITAFFRAVNDDGIPGVYTMPFSYHADEPASPRELLDYRHGLYPFVWFPHEILNNRLLDTRGLPELLMTHQNSFKLLHDSFADHTQLATVPPLEIAVNRPRGAVVVGPLKQVKTKRQGDVRWMDPPAYPKGNEHQQEEVRRQIDEYTGRISELVPPDLVALMQVFMTGQFLEFLRDAKRMILQLSQQYMTDESLARVIGPGGLPVARGIQEIQGQFDIELSFDPRDLNQEYLDKKITMIATALLPMDTLSTIQRDRLVQILFQSMDPNLAEETLQPVESANRREIEEEETNFVKIKAGIEPPLVPEGQNYQLRLQTIMGIGQKNPAAMQDLSEMSREILANRLKFFQFQLQQQQNAQIGRVGTQPTLDGQAQAAPQQGPPR